MTALQLFDGYKLMYLPMSFVYFGKYFTVSFCIDLDGWESWQYKQNTKYACDLVVYRSTLAIILRKTKRMRRDWQRLNVSFGPNLSMMSIH